MQKQEMDFAAIQYIYQFNADVQLIKLGMGINMACT
jgi:hypothetical protein